MSTGGRRERPEKILKDAAPALDQPHDNEKTVGIGDLAGPANQVVVGNDSIVITDARYCAKPHSLRRATRLLWMVVVGLCMPLIFCVDGTSLADTTAPLIMIHAQPGLYCHASCSFLRATRTTGPTADRKSKATRGCPELLTSKIPGKLKSAMLQKPFVLGTSQTATIQQSFIVKLIKKERPLDRPLRNQPNKIADESDNQFYSNRGTVA